MSGTYPIFEDKEFNLKIHAKKEFRDYQNTDVKDINFDKKFDDICNSDFELTNHQYFVKNYLSSNTPYNSLLLYHGLGTGKTCSAISICEEIRKIYKRTAYNKRIMIIASPNVQNNFKTQLFDSSKLKKENDVWKLNNTCVGNIILDEIFPKQNNNLSKNIIINSVERFINKHYVFMGYIEFANYINKLQDKKKSLHKEFNNRLLVIDEIHNMKTTCEKSNTLCAANLRLLVDNVKFMKLVFLTATPMFNSYSEIFELLNLMRSNDNLPRINENDILDKEGNFIVDDNTGEETGLQNFIEYTRGYVSFVRGENPYSFPFRIWPKLHSPNESSTNMKSYPMYSPDKQLIPENDKIKYLDLYTNSLMRNTFQFKAYQLLKTKYDSQDIATPHIINSMNQTLNFAYPDYIDTNEFNKHNSLYGKDGLLRLMNYNETKILSTNTNNESSRKVQYSYKQSTLTDYGKIFDHTIIGEYSHKLKNIADNITKSNGIVLIYSQFIEGGLIPTALMLEELGMNRYDGDNLLQTTNKNTKLSNKYVIISGDKRFSPNNNHAVSTCSQTNNIDGSVIKVILISKAGSEGIDFKFIRQVHILDPWYNLNRNEQIVGRAIRMCSHKGIPFINRNVSIYFHITYLDQNEESSDLYMYRLCEKKAIQISKISRLLKRNAVDCMLNIKQTTFTESDFNKTVNITLSNNKTVEFNVGDKPYTLFCDFEKNCSYKCINNASIHEPSEPLELDHSTYNFTLLESSIDIVTQKIINYFATHNGVTTYSKLENEAVFKKYHHTLIQFAVDKIVNSEQIVYDIYNREGTLAVFGNFILFNPLHLYSKSSVYDRLHPSRGKYSKVPFQYKPTFSSNDSLESNLKTINDSLNIVFSSPIDENALNKAESQNNWYKIANHFIYKIDPSNNSTIRSTIFGHVLDELVFEDKLKVMNFVYNSESHSQYSHLIKTEYINEIMKYIENRSFDFQNTRAINIQHEDTSLYILRDNIWSPSTFDEKKSFNKNFKVFYDKLMTSFNEQDNVIGFIQEHNKTYNYKIKDMSHKLSTGYRCTTSKRDIIEKNCEDLLHLLDNKYKNISFNESILKNTHPSNPKKEKKIFLTCVLHEILLRFSQLENTENKYWFLDTYDYLTMSKLMKNLKNKSTNET